MVDYDFIKKPIEKLTPFQKLIMRPLIDNTDILSKLRDEMNSRENLLIHHNEEIKIINKELNELRQIHYFLCKKPEDTKCSRD